MQNSLMGLLSKKRFGPFFVTQSLGAFNDNVFKNAVAFMVTYQAASYGISEKLSDVFANLLLLAIILPFFLFSAIAGQIADKYEKSSLVRRIKLLEIIIMAIAVYGFSTGNVYWLIFIALLMGTQSAFFGPIKYGILPQHLKDNELIAGNAAVETGTFIAILLGVIAGNKLMAIEGQGIVYVAVAVISIAVVGYLFSRFIPSAPAADPELKLNLNPVSSTLETLGYCRENDVVFKSILGISWFWFFGATILTQIPNYTQFYLAGDENVNILLLATFSIGIGLGAFLCEKASGDVVEIGLVPIGAFIITLFSLMLWWFSPVRLAEPPELLNSLSAFFDMSGAIGILVSVLGIGAAGGLFTVPLYALVQQRSSAQYRSRIIAGLNILNSLFMVVSAIASIAWLSAGMGISSMFVALAVLNVLVAIYIFKLVPEFMMRCIIWILVHVLYRVKHKGLENIPKEGAAVMVCNHVSFVDALVLASCSRRPPRFVMYYKIFAIPVMSFIFRTGKAIPIAGMKENPEMMERAFDSIAEALDNGDLVVIFPEGKLTGDGEIDAFKGGVERILERNPVPVIPMALRGLWGSFFSREGGSAMKRPLHRSLWSKIELFVGESIPAEQVTKERLQEVVESLRGEVK